MTIFATKLQATYPWRVLRDRADDGGIEAVVVVPYNEEHEAADGVGDFIDRVMKAAINRLPSEQTRAEKWGASRGLAIRPHQIVGYRTVPADELTLRDILDSDAMDLDYLTYGGDGVKGELPI